MKTCPHCHATHPDDLAVCPVDGTPLVEPAAWPEGTVIKGEYRILGKIGQDVVCTVYKALQLKSDQLCSLNVMSWGLACDPAFVKLFEQDALQRKKLRHPNVSRVEGIGEAEDGRPFIVMEYVAGQSLKKYIEQDAPFAPLRVCAIVKQVAAGLEAAHALGMVHRDVKPENIYLLDGPGSEKIKLLGLGISTLQEALLGDRFRTSPEAVIGTLQYLSPEQALGKMSDHLDGRADLYSLGVIMYQMLTGWLPFQATTPADWMMAHIQEVPTPIRVAHAKLAIPDALTDLVMRCLDKNRESRPASARDFIREVEQVEKEIDQTVIAGKAAPKTREPRKVSSGWKFWKS
ncbi:MAG: serine/threonine-protein kinase [Terriglobia bacterium]|jgi:serine/threonine-protein kinase